MFSLKTNLLPTPPNPSVFRLNVEQFDANFFFVSVQTVENQIRNI